MRFNRLFLICCILLSLIIIIPCSFASEASDITSEGMIDLDIESYSINRDNTTIFTSDSSSGYSNSSSEMLSKSRYDAYVSSSAYEEGDGSIEKPYKTLQKAFEFTKDNGSIYVFNGSYGVVDYNLSKSVTVVGEDRDAVLIDANKEGSIFTINGGNIVFSNLSFVNGCSLSGYECAGGITKIYGNLVFSNCGFYNNIGPDAGALYNAAGDLTIDSCIFRSNVLSRTGGCDGGGAVFLLYGDVVIKNSLFDNNTSYDFPGGAVYQIKSNLVISNSTFIDNKVVNGYGGALYFNQQGHNKVINCTFINNTAINGGAIYSDVGKSKDPGDLTVDSCNFDRNSANDGGSIYVTGEYSTVNIKNSKFTNSFASNYGGAIYNYLSTINLVNNTVFNCSAGKTGQYIHNKGYIVNSYVNFLNVSLIHVDVGDNIVLNASVYDDKSNPIDYGEIYFKVNDVNVSKAVVTDGFAVSTEYPISHNGTYEVSGYYSQGKNIIYSAIMTTDILGISIESKDLKVNSKDKTLFKVKITNYEGDPLSNLKIKFKLFDEDGNSKIYQSITDNNGYAGFKDYLNPGKWVVYSIFEGSSAYYSSEVINNIIVVNNSANSNSHYKNTTKKHSNLNLNNLNSDNFNSNNSHSNNLNSDKENVLEGNSMPKVGLSFNILIVMLILIILSFSVSKRFL